MAKLSQEDYEYRRTANSVSSINYHFVFVPKRRKPVLVKDVARRLQEIIFEVVQLAFDREDSIMKKKLHLG